jgi:hypothetical protein
MPFRIVVLTFYQDLRMSVFVLCGAGKKRPVLLRYHILYLAERDFPTLRSFFPTADGTPMAL